MRKYNKTENTMANQKTQWQIKKHNGKSKYTMANQKTKCVAGG